MSSPRKPAVLVSSRRQLLGVIGTSAAFIGGGGAGQAAAIEASGSLAVSEEITQQLEQVLKRIWSGEALPVRISRKQLNDVALQRIHGHLQNVLSDESYIEHIEAQIEAEIITGELVLAGDWLLSPTERDVCGMLLILGRGAPEAGMA